MRFARVALLGLCLLGPSLPASAGDWPGWRGPSGNGLSEERDPPLSWSADEGIAWKIPLPGKGVSQPIIVGDRLFLTASSGPRHEQLHLLCFDTRDGQRLWERTFWGTAPTLYHAQKSSMATPTPVTDGQHVWAFYGTGDLFCVNLAGEVQWIRSLAQEYEPFQNRFGMGGSLLLAGNVLVVPCDHWGNSYLLGVEKTTGRNVWKTPRTEHVSWSTPLLWKTRDRNELVISATFGVKSYDPQTGTALWSASGLTRECIPTPVATPEMIYVVSGYDGQTLAVRAGGQGDVTETHVAWKNQRGAPFVPSAILVDELYYLIEDRGIATCLEAGSGKVVWQKRLGGAFTASPIAAAGRVYFLAENGAMTVLGTGREPTILAKNELDEPCFATPALAQGRLYLRSDQHLFAIDGAQRKAQ